MNQFIQNMEWLENPLIPRTAFRNRGYVPKKYSLMGRLIKKKAFLNKIAGYRSHKYKYYPKLNEYNVWSRVFKNIYGSKNPNPLR